MKRLRNLVCAFAVCLLTLCLLPATVYAGDAVEEKTVGKATATKYENGNIFVYANGENIIIESSGVYADENKDGNVEADERLCDATDDTLIYGGTYDTDLEANTKITMNGGTVRRIAGGNRSSSTLTGNVEIVIKGGQAKSVLSAGEYGTLVGSASVTVEGGNVDYLYAYGLESVSSITGDCTVNIQGGLVSELRGGFGGVGGDVTFTVSGGEISTLYTVFGNSRVDKNVSLNATGGSIGSIYYFYDAGSCGTMSIFTDSDVAVNKLIPYRSGGIGTAGSISATILDPNGCIFSKDPATPATNLLVRESNGDWVVKGNVAVPAGTVLTIPEGASLTIPAGASLTNNGIIKCGGTLTKTGTFTDNGIVTCLTHSYEYDDVIGYCCTRCGIARDICAMNNDGAHSFTYTADDANNILTQTCSRDCGHKGTVTLTHSGTAYVGTAASQSVLTTMVRDNGWEGLNPETTYTAEGLPEEEIMVNGSLSNVLTQAPRTVTATMSEGGQSVSLAIQVDYLPLPDTPYTLPATSCVVNGVCWTADGNPVDFSAPEDFTILDENGAFSGTLHYAQPDAGTISGKTFQLKRIDDGALTEPVPLPEMKWDSAVPFGNIDLTTSIGCVYSTDKNENPAFGVFLKEEPYVKIAARDDESGIEEIGYYVATGAQENPKALTYESFPNTSVYLKKGKHIVYARITDNVGNVTYLNTAGIVVYEDATTHEANQKLQDYYFKEGTVRRLSFMSNDNTVKEVKLDETVLAKDTDYLVIKNGVELKASALDKLSAGDYTLTISFNPRGETYVEADYNHTPNALTYSITVKPMPVENVAKPALKTGLIYSTQAHELLTKNETVEGTYEYAIGTDDTNLPVDGWSADVPTATNAGTYHLWFRATPEDTENYEGTTGTYVGSVEITKAVPDRMLFPVATNEITYGEPLKNVELSFVSNDLGAFDWKEPDLVKNAGNHDIEVDFTPSAMAMQNYDWSKYSGNEVSNAIWVSDDQVLRRWIPVTVNKAEMGSVTPTGEDLLFNNEQQELVNPGRCEQGDVLYSMRENGTYGKNIPAAREAGLYTVWYKFVPSAENANNYNEVAPQAITISIDKAVPELKNVKAEIVKDTTDLSAVIVNYEVQDWQSGTLQLDADQSLKLGENTLTYTFTPDDSSNLDAAYGSVKVTVVDTIPPTGEVSLSANIWKEFLNAVSFGKFYKENQTLKVTASDSFSGVDKIEYFESKTALDLDGVKALADSDWTAMEGTLSVTAEDAKQFIYYVRISDKSGNVTYLSSDGAEFDTTAPVISDVHTGVTYYTTQSVKVTDKNLDSVTLNGVPVTGTMTLEGNKEATYTIVATDKAGNTTTVTVKMAPIQSLIEPVKGLTEETVTTDDRNNLQEIVDTADELLEAPSATYEEKAALEKIKADAEKLMAQVEEAVNAVQTEEVENTLQTTGENVTLSQKEDIQKAIETLEKAMENYGSNYSDSDKEELQQKLEELKAAEKTIADVEAAAAAIDELPKNVEPDDEETAKAITEAAKAYAALSEHGKSLVKDAAAKKLLALVEALTDYEIIKGDGAKWTEGDLTFTANGAYSKFAGIAVDGKEVDAKHYEAKSGSTIITLKESYLKTLSSGKHAIAVVYTDGAAEGTFTIKATAVNPDVPDTGDGANLMLWMCVSALSVVVLATQRRRNCVK